MQSLKIIVILLLPLLLVQCQSSTEQSIGEASSPLAPKPEAISLDGQALFPPPETPASQHKKDSLLAIAKTNFETTPDHLDHIIWLGRRLAYLSRYQEAIATFTAGLEKHPNEPALYRHRGHRYLSTRQFDLAIADFEKAASLARDRPIEIEPDGMPNKQNIPLSTLQFNIWYHWALAYYLKGDFEKAATLYTECMAYSTNPDLLTATTDWLYMTYRRLGKEAEAAALLNAITADLAVIENESYLNRLLMYKGLKQPEDLLDLSNNDPDQLLHIVTQGYGVGNWYLYQGDTVKAKAIFEKIRATTYWSAFGYIAAEADGLR
ncbi:MAG: hypothetical protein R2828_21010 [Saprospiraceae bacterium]